LNIDRSVKHSPKTLPQQVLSLDKGWVFQSTTTAGANAPARVVVKRNVRDIDRDRVRTFLQQLQFEPAPPAGAEGQGEARCVFGLFVFLERLHVCV
jgi:hypothetical protein